MLKLVVVLVIAFGGYKIFIDPEGFMATSPSKVQSHEYKFQVEFPNKHEEKTRVIDLSEFGKVKLTTYSIKSPELMCSVAISEYLGNTKVSGDIYDLIESSRKHLLRDFGGKLKQGEFIYNGNVTGYEFNMVTNSEKLLQSQIFTFEDNAYNVICQFQDNDQYRKVAHEFMQSFTFT